MCSFAFLVLHKVSVKLLKHLTLLCILFIWLVLTPLELLKCKSDNSHLFAKPLPPGIWAHCPLCLHSLPWVSTIGHHALSWVLMHCFPYSSENCKKLPLFQFTQASDTLPGVSIHIIYHPLKHIFDFFFFIVEHISWLWCNLHRGVHFWIIFSLACSAPKSS